MKLYFCCSLVFAAFFSAQHGHFQKACAAIQRSSSHHQKHLGHGQLVTVCEVQISSPHLWTRHHELRVTTEENRHYKLNNSNLVTKIEHQSISPTNPDKEKGQCLLILTILSMLRGRGKENTVNGVCSTDLGNSVAGWHVHKVDSSLRIWTRSALG